VATTSPLVTKKGDIGPDGLPIPWWCPEVFYDNGRVRLRFDLAKVAQRQGNHLMLRQWRRLTHAAAGIVSLSIRTMAGAGSGSGIAATSSI
jgi:hypothetical protein